MEAQTNCCRCGRKITVVMPDEVSEVLKQIHLTTTKCPGCSKAKTPENQYRELREQLRLAIQSGGPTDGIEERMARLESDFQRRGVAANDL